MKKTSIKIDPTKYDKEDIVSVLKYALSQFGNDISGEPDRLRYIISDLAPELQRECKLLYLMAKNGNLKKTANSSKWTESELALWVDNSTIFLAEEELIDKAVAYNFARDIIIGISGKTIENKMPQKSSKKKNVSVSSVCSEVTQTDPLKELEKLKKLLAKEEKARKAAEKKAKSEADARKKLEAEKQQRELDELVKSILGDRKTTSNTGSTPKKVDGIDYSEHTTAQKLFNKYNGKIRGNIIVVADEWTGDYCFVIDEIVRMSGLKAKGTAYLNGEFHKNYSYSADELIFHMYDGPSKDRINRIHVKRTSTVSSTSSKTTSKKSVTSKSTSGTRKSVTTYGSRFADGKTLKSFFANNGFEVIDKRNYGGCLWIVGDRKKLDPYIEAARMKFGSTCVGDFASGKSTGYRMGWWTKCSK